MYYNFKADGPSAKAYYLGEYESGAQINVAAKYPNYSLLTQDNFVIQPKAKTLSVTGNRVGRHTFDNGIEEGGSAYISVRGSSSITAPTISYDSSTGALSFSQTISVDVGAGIWDSTSEAKKSGSGTITAKVYLLPEIENL